MNVEPGPVVVIVFVDVGLVVLSFPYTDVEVVALGDMEEYSTVVKRSKSPAFAVTLCVGPRRMTTGYIN